MSELKDYMASTIERHIGRKLNFRKDIILEKDSSGSVVIKKWNIPETQPTIQQLTNTFTSNQIEITQGTEISKNSKRILNQHLLAGGGKITYTNGRVKWSDKFIIPIVSKLDSVDGYFDITMPSLNTVVHKNDGTTVTVDSDGIPLSNWEALYYKVNWGGSYQTLDTNFMIVDRANVVVNTNEDWVLLLIKDGTTGEVRTANYNHSNETFECLDLLVDNDILKTSYINRRVGVNTGIPLSTLDVNGSLSINTKTINSNYTLTEEDFFVIANNKTNITIYLPNASTCYGRLYVIKNRGGKGVSIRAVTGQLIDSSTSLSINSTNQRCMLVSDGANWYRID